MANIHLIKELPKAIKKHISKGKYESLVIDRSAFEAEQVVINIKKNLRHRLIVNDREVIQAGNLNGFDDFVGSFLAIDGKYWKFHVQIAKSLFKGVTANVDIWVEEEEEVAQFIIASIESSGVTITQSEKCLELTNRFADMLDFIDRY